jgi:LuxR family maltose regulon positive regulatory protein
VELTPAEHRVLEQLATHRTLAEIGDHLFVSRNTVKTHTVSIYRKLHVSGRSGAIERAIELNLLDDRSRDGDRAAAGTR